MKNQAHGLPVGAFAAAAGVTVAPSSAAFSAAAIAPPPLPMTAMRREEFFNDGYFPFTVDG